MMNYFDSHAHYDDKRFKQDREELLRELLPSCGVSNVINIGCDVKSSEMSIRLAEKYDYIYAAVGVHPHELYDMSSQTIAKLKKLSEHKKVVAIGKSVWIIIMIPTRRNYSASGSVSSSDWRRKPICLLSFIPEMRRRKPLISSRHPLCAAALSTAIPALPKWHWIM